MANKFIAILAAALLIVCRFDVAAMSAAEPPSSDVRSAAKPFSKPLYAATDFAGDWVRNGRYDRRDLDVMFDYLARLGVTRVDWLYSPIISTEDDYPGGFNVVRYFVEAAHRRGMKACFVFKPFETGIGRALPQTFPRPDGVPYLDDIRGIMPFVAPFVAAHPEFRYKRIPGKWEVGGRIGAIKLVKADSAPTRIRKEHLSIWTSALNNRFEHYVGDFTFTDEVEHRLDFPRSHTSRALTLGGLDIPEDRRYVVIKCSLTDDAADFTNETADLVELYNTTGELIPSTPGSAPANEQYVRDMIEQLPLCAYGRHPEVQSLLADPAALKTHFDDFYCFDHFYHNREVCRGMSHTLDRAGFAAAARGKAEHLPGAMHSSHPEVREHWLSELKRFTSYGFDTVSFRESNHSSTSHEREEYGFNAPVFENGRLDVAETARAAGQAYTDFLCEAAERLRRNGIRVEVHLYASHVGLESQRAGGGPTSPEPFVEWDWETWIRQCADGVQLRTHGGYRPTTFQYLVDRFTRQTDADRKREFVLQVRIRGVERPYGQQMLRWYLDYAAEHPGIDAFLLYETAAMMKRDATGNIVGESCLPVLLRGSD